MTWGMEDQVTERFTGAAEANGRAAGLQNELEVLFDAQNTSRKGGTSIPATFLRVSAAA